jgi:hypothetical protein
MDNQLDFKKLQEICDNITEISANAFDDFLMYYVSDREGFDVKMDSILKAFKHITREIDQSYVGYFKAEFVTIKIFGTNGLLKKYLNQAAVKSLPAKEYDFLECQLTKPWKYAFTIIKTNYKNDFYLMFDIFREEDYLVYSPGISDALAEKEVDIWFNILTFNGHCWQTHGLIVDLKNFTADDLYFYATELNPKIDSVEEFLLDIEKNPFPYRLLAVFNELKIIKVDSVEIKYHISNDFVQDLPNDGIEKHFVKQWNKGVYKFTLKESNNLPVQPEFFYNEKTGNLLRFSLTQEGFQRLNTILSIYGYDLEDEADIQVSLSLPDIIQAIINKKISLNPYENLFIKKNELKPFELIHYMLTNKLIDKLNPYAEKGEEPDLEAIMKELEISEDLFMKLFKAIIEYQKIEGNIV